MRLFQDLSDTIRLYEVFPRPRDTIRMVQGFVKTFSDTVRMVQVFFKALTKLVWLQPRKFSRR